MYKKGARNGLVTFQLKPAKPAKKVLLTGSFTDWVPTPMRRQKDGSYAADFPLEAGVHEYKFLVDGQWMTDPDNEQMKWNSLGTMNSVAGIE